jgi:hypothetical protein
MISMVLRLVKFLLPGLGQFGHSPGRAEEAEVQARVQGRVVSVDGKGFSTDGLPRFVKPGTGDDERDSGTAARTARCYPR